MTNAPNLTHDEALLLLNDHVGKDVQYSLSTSYDDPPNSWVRVLTLHGALTRVAEPEEIDAAELPERSRALFLSTYRIGKQSIVLPPTLGSAKGLPRGIEFTPAENVRLQILWGATPSPATGSGEPV